MTQLKDHVGYWLNRLRMEVHQTFEKRLEKHDISVAQWCILATLHSESADSVSTLARYIEVDIASISRVVERLVAKSLVENQPGKNRRSGIIKLTKQGRDLVPKLFDEAKDNEEQFFGGLTTDEKKQLKKIFLKIFTTIPSIALSGWLEN